MANYDMPTEYDVSEKRGGGGGGGGGGRGGGGGGGGRTMSQARAGKSNGVADRDATVAKKLGKQGGAANGKNKAGANKQSEHSSEPSNEKQQAYTTTNVNIPLSWTITPNDQKLKPISIGDALEKHGIVGDVSVLSAVGRQSDNTVPSPMLLTLAGPAGKGVVVSKGRDIAGNTYTAMIPRHSKVYDNGGDELYKRPFNPADLKDLAAHMEVDVGAMKDRVQPYYGHGGKMHQTHVEVHQAGNPALYQLIEESEGLQTALRGDSISNPSFIISREEHGRAVEAYVKRGGYKRSGRVNAKEITASLHHLGTGHDAAENKEAWNTTTTLRGLTAAERKELASVDGSHRVTYELQLLVAHKPSANANAHANQSDDEEQDD